jgi:prephenate dehydratase
MLDERPIIGIQGGKGSFNETAILAYLGRNRIATFDIRYLHTTERVLKAIEDGDVDNGQFAVYNSTGGLVDESIQSMVRHNFEIIDRYCIRVSHSLMINKDADPQRIDTILTHPQVLKQCKRKVASKYPNLRLQTGEGQLSDPAKVGELLSRGELPMTIATLSNSKIAEVFDLRVIENNLQDHRDNKTTFLLAGPTLVASQTNRSSVPELEFKV